MRLHHVLSLAEHSYDRAPVRGGRLTAGTASSYAGQTEFLHIPLPGRYIPHVWRSHSAPSSVSGPADRIARNGPRDDTGCRAGGRQSELTTAAALSPLQRDQRGHDDDQEDARYHPVDHAACLSVPPSVARRPGRLAPGAARWVCWADWGAPLALISVESRPCDPTANSGSGSAGCF